MPRLLPHRGLLDAVRDRVAQQVLERRQHRLEHLPVDLVALAVDDELRLLAGVGARLTHDALQARHVPVERHHARLHEAVLQIGSHARLLRQQRVGLVREAVQQLVDARDVVRRLRERARQLLNRRVAIELERVEAALDVRIVLVAVQDLRLGLGLELAQLLAQARNRAAELAQVKLDRVQLLAQPRLEDVDLAGAVQQHVEQAGIDARRLGALGGTLLDGRGAARARCDGGRGGGVGGATRAATTCR